MVVDRDLESDDSGGDESGTERDDEFDDKDTNLANSGLPPITHRDLSDLKM